VFGLMRRKTHLAIVRELQTTIQRQGDKIAEWRTIAIGEKNDNQRLRKRLKEMAQSSEEEGELCSARKER